MRVARIAACSLLALVGTVALLVGATMTVLRTGRGGELVKRIALGRVNAAIAGHLEVGRFSFGGDRVTLKEIELRDPDAAVVARVEEIVIAFSPMALFRSNVVISRADVVRPKAYLRQGTAGLNLARAIASKDGRPSSPRPIVKTHKSSGGLVFDVRDARVSDGVVELRAAAGSPGLGPAHTLRASNVSIDGRAHYEAGPEAFVLDARMEASVSEPLQGPVLVNVSGRARGAERQLGLTATIGDAAVDATLLTEGPDRSVVKLTRAHITPELVRSLLPRVELRVPLDLTAEAHRKGAIVTFTTAAKSTAGAIDARGTIDTISLRAHDVVVDAKHVNLEAIEGLPRSDLSLTADLDGGGRDPLALSGRIAVTVPAGVLDGTIVGPLSLKATASGGQYQLVDLSVVLPGVRVTGHGHAGPHRLAGHLGIVAADLARTRRSVASLRSLHIPVIAGNGKIDLDLGGTLAAPEVSASAAFPRLEVGEDNVAGLRFGAHVANVHAPEIGSADLHVVRAHVRGRSLQDVKVQAQSTSHRLAVDLQLGGTTAVSLRTAGRWAHHGEAFDLDTFELRYPGANWKLRGAAHLSLRPDHYAVDGLDLRARDQQLRLALDKRGDRIRGKVVITHLDLGALPREFLPPRQSVAGRLDVDAEVGGSLSRPTVRASIDLRGGRFGHYRDLALRLEKGSYGQGRASGDLRVQGLGTSLEARFDLPTKWPLRDQGAPLKLDLSIPETDLGILRNAFELPVGRRISGKIGLALHVSGSGNAPAVDLVTSSRDLIVDGQRLGSVALRVAGDREAPLTATLDIHAPDGGSGVGPSSERKRGAPVCAGTISVRTGLVMSSLARGLPTLDELMRTQFDVLGDLRDIPLGEVGRLAHSPELSGGTASLRMSATGTARSPTGALNVQVAGAAGPRFPPTDGRLDAAFGQRDTRLALRIVRGQKVLLSASGILGLASRRLTDRAALTKAPLSLKASLGPLRFHRDQVPGAGVGMPQTLSGTISAAVAIEGTLEQPALWMTADLAGVWLESRSLGGAHALMTYGSKEAGVAVEVHMDTGGDLRFTGHSSLDLGYPRVAQGLNVSETPFDATLTAQRLDLSPLSGLNREVGRVGGELSATLTARGKWGQPSVSGQLEWTHGVLALTGLGDYRDVHLKAHGDERAVWIDDLRLASGSGSARLTGSAARSGERGYALRAAMNARRFPIYGQGQPLAILSVDANVTGEASHTGAKASLKISDAHLELTDAKQKTLQPLGRPADVILMKAGKPADRAEAVKLRAFEADLKEAASTSAPMIVAPALDTPAAPFAVHLAVDAPRNVWVRGKDAALELGLAPGFRVEASGAPRIYGKVVVRRGRIDVLGRRFDLQAGSSVQFIGSPDTPRLDVSAKYLNETEHITVVLTAKGPLDHLVIAASSPDRPDLTEGQLYTLVVTGRLQLGANSAGSASASSEAASLVGGLVAAQLQKALAKTLPLDVLTLQAGEGLSGSRLEAGTYLTSRLYAGYVGRVGADPALLQNSNAIHLEYQLSRRWSFDGEYGDVGTGTADVVWTKNY